MKETMKNQTQIPVNVTMSDARCALIINEVEILKRFVKDLTKVKAYLKDAESQSQDYMKSAQKESKYEGKLEGRISGLLYGVEYVNILIDSYNREIERRAADLRTKTFF